MSTLAPQRHALALYKSSPVKITEVAEKIAIELPNGKSKSVREKDILVLHPGPISSLKTLDPDLQGELEEAWELVGDESVNVSELAELIYGDGSPEHVWAAWRRVQEGLYFHGTPDEISAYPAETVETVKAEREAKQKAFEEKKAFLERLQARKLEPEDFDKIKDLDRVALGSEEVSPTLRDLKREQSAQAAHRLLLELNAWPLSRNPYPKRMGLELDDPEGEVLPLPDEKRVDLTHLDAWAIDDEGNQDPDDAISLESNSEKSDKIWVHVADVAALVAPNTQLDTDAQARGANLYIPEHTYTMLPRAITHELGLGLNETSPALSFSFTLSDDAKVENVEIMPSWVKVTRKTYQEVEDQIEESPFAELYAKAVQFQQKRVENGAIRLDLPEVKIRVKNAEADTEKNVPEVSFTPLPGLRSRDLVTEFMLMAGKAAATFSTENDIPFPYSTQPPPEPDEQGNPVPHPETLAENYAFRRRFKKSQLKSLAEPHSGLGMEQYSQVTSPLRRYLDLVAHQQLRAFLKGEPLLDREALTERVGAAEAVIRNVRKAERFSNQHWTLFWLHQNPEWTGEGMIVDYMRQKATVLVPELGLECKVRLREEPQLNSTVALKMGEVDLPELDTYLRVYKPK